jgi:hypothetical protein
MGNFMKNKHIFAVISIMLVPVIFSGCVTPPPPVKEAASPPDTFIALTLSILQRLGESYESNDIGRYQLVLVGKIIMEREYTIKKQVVISGKASFENEYIREVTTINDQTKGQALKMENRGGRAVISVCFEELGGIYKEDYNLSFSCRAEETDEYFSIDYFPGETSALSEEKGTLEYGGNSFRLKYTVDPRPYLLIKLSQKDTERLISRVVPGRVVN